MNRWPGPGKQVGLTNVEGWTEDCISMILEAGVKRLAALYFPYPFAPYLRPDRDISRFGFGGRLAHSMSGDALKYK